MSQCWLIPAAAAEVEETYVYIGQDSLDAARRFRRRCSETFAWIAGMPGIGRAWRARSPRLKGVRVWPVAGFPNHLVFYQAHRQGILVLHVVSGARDLPRFLKK